LENHQNFKLEDNADAKKTDEKSVFDEEDEFEKAHTVNTETTFAQPSEN
jgi:hypothetical protein